jgi:hypothetical protein
VIRHSASARLLVGSTSRLGALSLVAIAGGLLAACGSTASAGSSNPGSGSQNNSGTTQQGSSSGGGSVNDGIGHPVNVCSVLPVATVASVTGEPLTQAEEQDTTSYKIYMCNYTSADGTSGVTVSVLALDAAVGYDASVQAAGAGGKPISGLGDKAFTSILGVEALFGNVSISVSNLQSDAAAETLIKDLQPKL